MNPEHQLCFPPFRLDLVNEQLWRETQEIPLRQKTFAVLRHLVEHSDQLVTKEALLDAVWAGTAVSDVAPGVCVQELRRALGEDRQTPRFIVTVHRRGYRFIAPLTTASPVSSSKFLVSSPKDEQRETRNQKLETPLVGREAELSQLHQVLGRALGGERQIVFVTGEAGIGKTTVVEAFLARITRGHEHEHVHEIWIGRGQCIEHYGAGEAYMPVLEALGRLCRAPGGERLIALLAQQAPTWLVQMPALLSAAELEALQRKVLGATQGRMLREMAEAVEVLTAETPLILVLEDLQWSDASTLEWLSALARWRERARLLVIGTYRAVDVIVREHPLKAVKQELQLHGYCDELPLACLSEAAVGEYLVARFEVGATDRSPLRDLARVIYQRTDGNPLFLVTVADYLVTQGVIVQGEGSWDLKGELEEVEVVAPESLRQMIAKQIERLSPEDQRVLEVGSVVGVEFSAAAVAAGIEAEVGQVEERCEGLVRREQLLRAKGEEEWPDETVAARYGFLHALYQEVLYERVTAGRRSRVHRRIGERKETAYGKRAGEIAAELALHFEQGREYRKAVQYLQQAGENARRRSAYVEAINHLTTGLELLKTLPDTSERAQQEITLQLALSVSLVATKGVTVPAVEQACTRALELCRQVGETPQRLPVLLSLSALCMSQGKLQTARELAEQSLTLAQGAQDQAFLLPAHNMLGSTLRSMGELVPAREHLEQSIALYDPQRHRSMSLMHGLESGVSCLFLTAMVLGPLGYPDQALQRIRAALTLAHELSHPLSLAYTLGFAAMVHQARREAQAVQEHAEAMIALSRE